MRRTTAIAVSTFLMLSASLSLSALAATPSTWHVQAGSVGITGGAPDGRFGNAFYPSNIFAHPGDSIVFNSPSPHTVTFNRPVAPLFAFFAPAGDTLSAPGQYVNSGFLEPGASFTLHLGPSLPAGTYAYLCSLHLGMRGRIEVVPATAPIARQNAALAARASERMVRDLAKAAAIGDRASDRAAKTKQTVLVGAGDHRVTNTLFYPAAITIHAGQSIEFLKTKDPTEPHTVTFGPEPADMLAQLLPAGGPPFVYDGAASTLVNSGILVTKRQYGAFYHLELAHFPPQLDRVSITFTRPGTYPYICALHDEVGMRGTVTVLP